MATLTRRDFRAIIHYNFARGLSKVFQRNVGSVWWGLSFRQNCRTLLFTIPARNLRSRRSTAHRTPIGRCYSRICSDAVRKAKTLNRRITYRQLEELLHVPKSTLQRIVSEQLYVRKMCTSWVPHALSDEQRENRVKWCKKMLKKFCKSGFAAEVNFIMRGDETWLYYYDVPTKSQSKVWIFEDEEVPVQVRKSKSIGKRMVTVFFTKGAILTNVCLEKSETVTAKWYTATCLP